MLIGLVHFSVASHYCDDMGVASEVSFSGNLASCGMEDSEDILPVSGISLSSHCCDDVVAFYGIDANFIPSFSVVPELFQYSVQVLIIHDQLLVVHSPALTSLHTSVEPPGVLLSTYVDLSNICVFRI